MLGEKPFNVVLVLLEVILGLQLLDKAGHMMLLDQTSLVFWHNFHDKTV